MTTRIEESYWITLMGMTINNFVIDVFISNIVCKYAQFLDSSCLSHQIKSFSI